MIPAMFHARFPRAAVLVLAAAALLASAVPVRAAETASAYASFRRGDYAGAFRKYKRLARQGDPYGQYNLAMFYLDDGLGVPQDYARAVHWFEAAARQGHPQAPFPAALLYAAPKPPR